MKLILLSGPGSGKGTQAAKLQDYYGISHISTGELLRDARAAGTELGKKAAEYMDAGKLVPDVVILGIVSEKLGVQETGKGFLFDGFPRTFSQAKGLDKILQEKTAGVLSGNGQPIDAVIFLDVPDEIVVERLLKRADIEGRSDDNRETIENRLKVYHQETEPLKSYYEERGLLKSVDGVGTVDEVFERIKVILN